MSDYDDKKVKANGLTEREESQLPNWAQERISDFRDQLQALKRENNALIEASDAPNEKTAVSYGDVENDPHYLPDGMTDAVRYSIDNGHIDIRLKKDGLELSGSDDLGFTPQAVNVIRVHLND